MISIFPGGRDVMVCGSSARTSLLTSTLGLHLHATLAETETELPLGVLRLGVRSGQEAGTGPEVRVKSRHWMEGFKDIAEAVREVAGKTRMISVCDREADLFELFDRQRQRPRVEILPCPA